MHAEDALKPDSPPVHRGARLQRAARPHLCLGRSGKTFCREPAPSVVPGDLGPQFHRADRDLWRRGVLGSVARDAGRLGLDPDAEIPRSDRARVADSRQQCARASGRRCRRQLRRQARHQADRAGGASGAAARPAGAADRGPAGEHARRRRPWPGTHLRCRGRLQRRRHRQIDEDEARWTMPAPMPAARRSNWASRSAPSSVPTRSKACSIARSR